MILVDTSIFVSVLRDRTGANAHRLLAEVGGDDIAVTRLGAAELLSGAKDAKEWSAIERYLSARTVFELDATTWTEAARLYFDLRRKGKIIRKLADCCIAQAALDHDIPVLPNDRDFEMIATIRPLKHKRLNLAKA